MNEKIEADFKEALVLAKKIDKLIRNEDASMRDSFISVLLILIIISKAKQKDGENLDHFCDRVTNFIRDNQDSVSVE